MHLILLKLARFINKKEQKKLENDIEVILKPHVEKIDVIRDNWIRKNRILVKIDLKSQNFEAILKILFNTPGISSVVYFDSEFFNWESSSLMELTTKISKYININKSDKIFNLDFKAINGVPIHKKALIDRLQKSNLIYNPKSDFTLYIELKKSEKHIKKANKTILTRIGRKFSNLFQPAEKDLPFTPNLVLYSPFTAQEISDFFRLGLSFNTTIILTNENKKVEKLVKEVKKSYFKGISKIKFEIVTSLTDLLSKNKESLFIGFSLWGTRSIKELSQLIPTSVIHLNSSSIKKPSIFFLFGNEEVGLPLFIRYQIPILKIGSSSEPLRASQAAAYSLGIILNQ